MACAPAAGAPCRLKRPFQRRLDRGGGRVQVRAVEAQARLQSQRIPRAQADRRNARLIQQGLRKGGRAVGRDADLEAVLAGVARAGDGAGRACDFHLAKVHEPHGRGPGRQGGYGGARGGTLHRDQGTIGKLGHLA